MAEPHFARRSPCLALALEEPRLCRRRRCDARPRHRREHRYFQLDLFRSAKAAPLPRARPHVQRGDDTAKTERFLEFAYARPGLPGVAPGKHRVWVNGHADAGAMDTHWL